MMHGHEGQGATPFAAARPPVAFDVNTVRRDFPILGSSVHGKPLVYLDNAATTPKPQAVIDAVAHALSHDTANIGRGVHALAERATALHERARETARDFLNAGSAEEVVFVRGTTEALNLLAATFGRQRVRRGDEVVVSALEHHSNLLPWQRLCAERGATLRMVPLTADGEIDLEALGAMLTLRTRLVAVSHVSNVLGTVNPVAQIVRMAHARGAAVIVDGAQAAPHRELDVRSLGCDFYAFSAHKLYGPSGIGVLWGRKELLADMPPYQVGGGMVDEVGDETSTYASGPHRFEAGTPAIEGVAGMAAAMNYLDALDRPSAVLWEETLLAAAVARLSALPGVRVLGDPAERAPVLSFVVDGIHPHDLASILDGEGVAVRAGHHCAQPLMRRLGVPATTRASFAFYNTLDEVETLARAVQRAQEMLS
jgi:cysteine desulfurase/selenocysteine lyase